MKKPYMARYGARCLEHGYLPIPVAPGKKYPVVKNWRNAVFGANELQRWSGYGVGLRCGAGAHPLCAIDIDVSDASLADWLRDWCLRELGDALMRIGQPPRLLMVYRAQASGWTKSKGDTYEDFVGDTHALEILGDGQQFVAYGWHEGAQRDYEWVDLWGGPVQVRASELTVVSADGIQGLLAEWQRKALECGMAVAAGGTGGRGPRPAQTTNDPLASYEPPLGLSLEETRGLLYAGGGDPANYDQWLRAGMALHHEYAASRHASEAMDLWDQWSAQAGNYIGRDDLQARWDGFASAEGRRSVTLRTLVAAVGGFARVRALASSDSAGAGQGQRAPGPSGKGGGAKSSRGATHPRTEVGNGRRLVDAYDDELIYCAELGQWYRWSGVYWRAMSSVELRHLAGVTVDLMLAETDGLNEEDAAPIYKWWAQSSKLAMLENMGKLAAAEPHLWVRVSELDAERHLLGVRNGVVDLRSGRLLAPDPRARVTRVGACDWIADAPCPWWESTLVDIFRGDLEIIKFVQRLFGYILLGEPVEDLLVILYGTGNNGKSTMLNALRYVLGMHAVMADAATFLRSGGAGAQAGAARPDVLAMSGARMVAVSEPEEGGELREALVKSMTGGEAIPARALYSNQIIQLQPTWTAVMCTNHKPIIRGDDTGIWRRLMLLNFDRDFDQDGDVTKDPHRDIKLRAEASGILRWLVQGALEYQRQGLRLPGQVERARQEYRGEMDLLADWLQGRCVRDALARTSLDQLWVDWQGWAGARGELRYIASSRALSRRLQARGFKREHARIGTVFWGLKLRDLAIS